MKDLFKTLAILGIVIIAYSCSTSKPEISEIAITKDDLLDKIKGGWAGQVIGCTTVVRLSFNGTVQ